MKTNQEYMREGIGLADGFSIRSFHDNGFVFGYGENDDLAYNFICGLDNLPKWFLPALASQLTDQVDALDDYSVSVDQFTATVLYLQGEQLKIGGHDRSMNTIRVTVDSRVLVEEEST
ncbi:MAG: hypothetical protein GXP16_01520 [Gammaproteobacteria bacterium]|nr:hypothetical protein [Gammaproteobacteria bacterium]